MPDHVLQFVLELFEAVLKVNLCSRPTLAGPDKSMNILIYFSIYQKSNFKLSSLKYISEIFPGQVDTFFWFYLRTNRNPEILDFTEMKLAIMMRWTNLTVQKPRKFWTSKPNCYLALQPDDIVFFSFLIFSLVWFIYPCKQGVGAGQILKVLQPLLRS